MKALRRKYAGMMSGISNGDSLLTFTAEQANSKIAMQAFGSAPAVLLEYNKNGTVWLPFIVGTTTVTLENVSDYVKFRGINAGFGTSASDYNRFTMSGRIAASGDITSIINNVGGDAVLQSFGLRGIFNNCTGLTTAPALPTTILASGCYYGIFGGCTGLVTSPKLIATTLASDCYYYMFGNCQSITSHDVATLNNSGYTFQGNSSCTSLTIHAVTPPTIAGTAFSGLKADCIIYVPAESVNAYKAAQYWSARAAYIQAIPT